MPEVGAGWTGTVNVEVTGAEGDEGYLVVRIKGERTGTPVQVREEDVVGLRPPKMVRRDVRS
jgi:hypothetical protein